MQRSKLLEGDVGWRRRRVHHDRIRTDLVALPEDVERADRERDGELPTGISCTRNLVREAFDASRSASDSS